jgi:hypothetical protein
VSPVSGEQRQLTNRRVVSDRRSGVERRNAERRERGPQWTGQERMLILVDVERRSGTDGRDNAERGVSGERRSGVERRGQTVGEHLRNALELIARVAESGGLDDEFRRDLDTAVVRLRLALDRLEGGSR